MSFTSSTFFIFLLFLLPIYWLARGKTLQNVILLIAGYIFYGWGHPGYALLLAASTVADYFISIALPRPGAKKKALLCASLLVNLGVLAFFKYADFFVPNVVDALTTAGIQVAPWSLEILIPAGISFYTLKKLSYIIDIYRKTAPPATNFVDFALYVSFFPQILAGPIDHHRKLLPQIQKTRQWSWDYLHAAWPLFLMGWIKKVVVADSVKVIADKIYALQEPSKLLLLVGTLAFALQILADFSAYTDLARGAAYLIGFETSENFNSPYLARSPSEFWGRWHITLSNWLRDYIFFPARRWMLVRCRSTAPFLPLMLPPLLTMLISGLWHGTGWNFVIWGIYHGALIAIYQRLEMGGKLKPSGWFKAMSAWVVMFALTLLGWMLFRASSLTWLANALFHAPAIHSQNDVIASVVSLSMIAFYAMPLVIKMVIDRFFRQTEIVQGLYYALASLMLIIFISTSSPDFIYVQF